MAQETKISHSTPFKIFKDWFDEACNDSNIIEPTAMCLATTNLENKPSSRMVLLKKFDDRGFCFFTNLNSRKAQELKINQFVSTCFYWGSLKKQIRIEGQIEPVSTQEADEYFASRRTESKIGAWASRQSQIMGNWQEFMERIELIKKRFNGQPVPRPDFWSGFRIVPTAIEFWQEGEFRIHQRQLYQRFEDGWVVNQLYP